VIAALLLFFPMPADAESLTEGVADIIAGLFIVFEGTFKVGDMITVDDWHGQVQEIGIRNTTIRDLILEDVKIMNNSTIRSIINYSERPCWSPITVGVDYDTDIPALEAAFEREKAGMKKIEFTEIIEYRDKQHLCVYYEMRSR
jgi:small conductance mechanosensitive channel